MDSPYYVIRDKLLHHMAEDASMHLQIALEEQSLSITELDGLQAIFNYVQTNDPLLFSPQSLSFSAFFAFEGNQVENYTQALSDCLFFQGLSLLRYELIEDTERVLSLYDQFLNLLSNFSQNSTIKISESFVKHSILQSLLTWKSGDTASALYALNSLLSSVTSIFHPYFILLIQMYLTKFTGIAGDIDSAIQFGLSASDLLETYENQAIYFEVSGWLATWYYLKWDIDLAYPRFKEIIASASMIFDKNIIYAAYIYIGSIYNLHGQTEQSIEVLELSLQKIESSNSFFRALSFLYLGISYRVAENYQSAIECLENALKIRKEQNIRDPQIIVSIGNVLFHLFLTYRELSDIVTMERITMEIKKLEDQASNVFLRIIHQECLAIILIKKGGLVNIGRAIGILKKTRALSEFSSSKFISIIGSITLVDLLLLEYKAIPNERTANTIYEVLSEMDASLDTQKITLLKGHILLLYAKFALLNSDIPKAVDLLTTFEQHDYKNFLNKNVSTEIVTIREAFTRMINQVKAYNLSENSQLTDVDEIRDYITDVMKMIGKFT